MHLEQILVSKGCVSPLKMLFMNDNQPTCMKASGFHGAVGHTIGVPGVSFCCTTALSLTEGEICDSVTI